MKVIEKEKPDSFFTDKEWNDLAEENRLADWHIRDYDKKIRMGIKF